MNKFFKLFLILFCVYNLSYSQKITQINTTVIAKDSSFTIKLIKRFHNKTNFTSTKQSIYDRDIFSPKSVNILDSKNKVYVNSLEGFSTIVYDLNTLKKLKVIKHEFNAKNQYLFKDTNYYNYKFTTKNKNFDFFKGKPVEGCFSHNNKYFWVTYYRRDYDKNAVNPSALCIIDTEKDSIVRVMPTAPLPKVITYSKETEKIIVTNWGDNTASIIDVSSEDVNSFKYVANIIVDKKYEVKNNNNLQIDRDKLCGDCLRGTAFSPDGKYVFLGKSMNNSLALIDVLESKYLGNIYGMKPEVRHIVVNNDYIYLAVTNLGFIQRTNIYNLIDSLTNGNFNYTSWDEIYLGKGIRTIKVTDDGKYLFAAINNESKIAVVNIKKYEIVCYIDADSYPVGLDVSKDGKYLFVTSQGKNGIGGNSLTVYELKYKNENLVRR
ncbi:MAG TPA: hypothetical protein PL041_11965 [Melioribacteraceae bacterium]|nr:hypothetical protein [Melioribacteraceae bacterium]